MRHRDVTRFSWLRFISVVKKEMLQIRRDPPSLAMAIAMPLFMLALFGYAINTDVDHIPTAVWDQDKSMHSRELVEQFVTTGYYDVLWQVHSYGEMEQLVDSGKARAGFIIPPDYSRKLDRREKVSVQILIDGADPNNARTALRNAQLIVQNKALSIQKVYLEKTGIATLQQPLDVLPRVLYNPDMESRVFNIPALMGLIMQNVTSILTAFALVRERERGTMEQLIVTPIRPVELILGKLVPYVGIGIFSFTIVLTFGVLWFGVPVKGSVTLLILLSLLFLVTTLALGLLFSAVARTQLQAMQMAMAFILPSVLLSGFMFPRETMPTVMQWIGGLLPITYFLEILRGIFLKGIGIQYLWKETLTLIIFTTVICFVAVRKFHKKME